MHDGAFLLADLVLGITDTVDQRFILFRDQLDRHEQGGQGLLLGNGFGAVARVLLQHLLQFFQLFLDGGKAQAGHFRIGATIAFVVIAVVVRVFLVVFLVVVLLGFLGGDRGYVVAVDAGHAVVIGIDIAAENVGQATAFLNHASVVGKDAVDGAGEHGDGRHNFTDAFLDALGDFDFAFASQQLDRTHFAHVHADRVGGATDIGFHGSQGSGSFFGGSFVGIIIGQQQRIGIGCGFKNRDAHVVDHADNVFHLFRIGDILGQVIVDLRIGQIALLATAGDELFKTGLLLRFSGHNNPCGCLGVQKISCGLYPDFAC